MLYRKTQVHDHISPNYSHNEKFFRQKLYGKSRHPSCSVPSFRESCHHGIIWNSTIQPDGSQMTLQYGACALHSSCLRLQTQSIYYSMLLPTKTVERTSLYVMFMCTLPLPVLFLNHSQSHYLNASLMFWIGNSTR